MKYDVVTIGDAFEDVFILPEDLIVKQDRTFTSGKGVSFELGEKIPLSEVDYDIGGSACNTAVGFSRLGFKTSIISIIGEDTPAEKILSRLDDEEVITKNILVDRKMKTNFSVIFRMDAGRTIFIYHGLKNYETLRIKKDIDPDWIFLAPLGENTDNIENDIISKVSEKGALLGWNPGAIQIKKGAGHYRHLLKNTTVLFLNREESIKFINYPVKPSDHEIIKKLHSFGPKIIVITSGKEGARAFDGKKHYKIDSLSNTVRVDSTGAGDSFAVGFLSRLMKEKTAEFNEELISECLKRGIINSNSVIQYVGAQNGLLSETVLKKELSEQKRLIVELE